MKKTFTLLFVISIALLLNSGCKKHDCNKPGKPTLTDAIITGTDFRKCACCGGLMITFSNDPKPYSADFYDIETMPANTGITEESKFPVYVKVKYTITGTCGNKVNISVLEKK